MEDQSPTTEPAASERCTTLTLADGTLHIISSPGLPDLSGGYHAGLRAIIHGGRLERDGQNVMIARSDGLTRRSVTIGRDTPETLSNFMAQCDGWISIEPDPEIDPEYVAIIESCAGGAALSGPHSGEQASKILAQRLGFKLRLAPDVAPAHLTPPPWTLTSRGICDRHGTLIYAKLSNPIAGEDLSVGSVPTPGETPEKTEADKASAGTMGRLRKILGGA